LYHDIGKMSNPIYFTENQSGVNPHDELTPEESAKIIISHVSEGLKLAHKNGLPLVIRDCIRSHHGNGPVRYFYNAFKNEHPEESVPETFFYTGTNPASKETAILMMADALEASSRSLKEYNETEISALVERIINMQFQEGAFKNVPITFRDLEKIKVVFKSKLQTIYHTRIAYPEMPAVIPPLVRD
jgi:Predicted membrane-associated HD superfamily hydrolase